MITQIVTNKEVTIKAPIEINTEVLIVIELSRPENSGVFTNTRIIFIVQEMPPEQG